MGALTTILIILAVIAFIASLKATVVISYAEEVRLYVKVLIFKIGILPSKEKKFKHKMSAKKAEKIKEKMRKKADKKRISSEEKKKKKAEKKETKEKKNISQILSDIKLFASLGVLVIEKFFGHLKIKIARIKLIIATPDAATTALAYGGVTQALNILLPVLESVKNFENLNKADIQVTADFVSDTPVIDIKLAFSIRVWHVFDIAFSALGRFIKKKLLSGDDQSNHKGPNNPTKKQNKKKNNLPKGK